MARFPLQDYYTGITPEEALECDTIDSEIGALLYKPSGPTSAHICALVIHPDYRGRGYAREFLAVLQRDYSVLTTNVLFSEVNRIPLWQHLGFVITETNPEQGYIQLQWLRPVRTPMIDPSLF
jgi:ribosomal protein S18 acetylase RimI-like enzyme